MTSETRQDALMNTALGTGLALMLLAGCQHAPGKKEPVADLGANPGQSQTATEPALATEATTTPDPTTPQEPAKTADLPKPAEPPRSTVTAKPPEGAPESAGRFRVTPPPKVTNAALMPLEDIGLMRGKIPPTLKSIKTPYANESAPTCESLGSAILALDLVLGPDVDVKLADQTLRQKGMDAAGDALVDALESTSTSVVPFRGWVRELSGASSRERRMSAAVQAGKLRRAYLKGIGQAMQCLPPAAPIPLVEK